MFLAPFDSQFQWVTSNVDATRPVQSGPYGTSTSVDADYNIYSTIFSRTQVLYDCYGILLCFNNYASSNAIRNALARIVITSGSNIPDFTNGIVIDNLIMGSASPYGLQAGGIWYYFPIFIKADSSIQVSMRGTATVATGTVAVAAWLFGAPKNPAAVRVGKYVDTFGVDTANFRGTTITLGTTNEGNFNQLGSATTRPYWWCQPGFSYADNSMTGSIITTDIAAGTSTTTNKLISKERRWVVTAAEQISSFPTFNLGMSGVNIPVGSNIYGRGQTNIATADTTPGIACYLLGG